MMHLLRLASIAFAVALVSAIGATIFTGAAWSAPSLPTITIAMDPTSITVGGTLESGAVDILSTVTGKSVGVPTLIRLNPGMTAAQALDIMAAHLATWNANDVSLVGAAVFDVWVAGGMTSDVQTVLRPGDYLAIDSAGYDPTKFTTTAFTIVPAVAPAALPAAQATIRAIDFGFRGATTLHNGQLVRVKNSGYVAHEIGALGFMNATTAKRAMVLLRAGKESKAESLANGVVIFTFPVDHGVVQQSVLKAKPGIYVLVCAEPTQDGRLYEQLGMVRMIHITK